MEVTLEAADVNPTPSYLSVRAAGQRKLCTVKPGQRIAFADLAAPGKVKVEVLEQVGVVTLPSDFPTSTKLAIPRSTGKPVEISCHRTGPMKTSSVASLPPIASPDPDTLDREEPLEKDRAAVAQRQYLEEHGVDEIVEDLVRELLLHQPKDPRAFLRKLFAGYPEDPSALSAALGDTCRELESWAKHFRAAGKEYEDTFTPELRDAIDQKTQEAAWWRLKSQQQYDAVGELESLRNLTAEAEAQRRAAESAATSAEAELRDVRQTKDQKIAALEREAARLGDQVQRQAADLARAHAETDGRMRQLRQQYDEAGASTKRRLAQAEFQLKASVRSGVQLQHRCRRLKDRLREVTGDNTIEMDSDTDDVQQMDSMQMSQDTLQFSGDITGMSPPRAMSPGPVSPVVPPIPIDQVPAYVDQR